MADSVSVEHGGMTITTNTATEADLRTEMEAPAVPTSQGDGDARPLDAGTPPPPVRDPQGRFAKAEAQTPPAEAPAAEPTEVAPEPPARRRDDTLPRHDPVARMKQAIAQKAQAEQRAAALEAELQRLRQPPLSVTSPVTPPPQNGHAQPHPGEPQFEQFADAPDPYTAYVQAWTRWDHATQLAQTRAQWDAEQAAKTQAKEFEARLSEGRKQYADYDQVLTEADTLGLQVSAVMQLAIAQSPKAADLVYFLATHPEECTQLAEESQATPVDAAPVMRRLLESQLGARAAPSNGTGPAAPPKISTAKPPVQPVGSSPVMGDDPPGDTASAAEHARYWNRKLKVPGTR
jgi:hypothetical protein